MKALVIAEHADNLAALCGKARSLADEVIAFAPQSVEVPGGIADTVVTVELPAGALLDDIDATVLSVVESKGVELVFAEPTRRIKAVAAKVACAKGTSVITDAIALEGDVATSLYFGGVGMRQQKPAGGFKIYTLTNDACAGATPSGANAAESVAFVAPERGAQVVATKAIEKSGVDLSKADVVVGAGRGFTAEEELDIARALVDKVGGGLACTRPLTEGVNWLPTELYIGVSGQMLTPKAYVACGISGQMQHMVGINRAGAIFAINKDKNAPIFKQCDYGLIGDVKDVLPKITAAL